MTSFSLKILAMIAMFFDHFGTAYLGPFSFFNLIGRIAFPIFAFQISEGYLHTQNLKRYFFRLGIFATISQIPFTLFMQKYTGSNLFYLNVFFTLFLGLFSIYIYDWTIESFKAKKNLKFNIDKIVGLIFVLITAYIANQLNSDYGLLGVITIFIFYLFKNSRKYKNISFIIICLLMYIPSFIVNNYNAFYILLCLFTMLALIPINIYNGKQGKKIKYSLYLFYPLHLFFLYLLF